MATQDINAKQYTCDGCGQIFLVELDDEPPVGFHGSHSHITGRGATGGQWFACHQGCILKAISVAERR